MSGVAIIYHSDAVHMLSDMAVFDETGAVCRIGTKTIRLTAAGVVVAIVAAFRYDIREHLPAAMIGARSLEDVIGIMPEYGRSVLSLARGSGLFETHHESPGISFFVAGMGAVSGRSEVWIFSPENDFEAVASPVLCHAPRVDHDAVLGRELVTLGDVFALDPVVDGIALMEAQRAEPHRVLDLIDDIHIIGGGVELTTIAAAGITQRVVHRWPDRLGERITP